MKCIYIYHNTALLSFYFMQEIAKGVYSRNNWNCCQEKFASSWSLFLSICVIVCFIFFRSEYLEVRLFFDSLSYVFMESVPEYSVIDGIGMFNVNHVICLSKCPYPEIDGIFPHKYSSYLN